MTDQDFLANDAAGFFRARWLGAVSLDRLFWFDMIVVGTVINIVTSFAALIVLGLKWPVWASIMVYLTPLPYNLFLVFAVWRTAEQLADQRTASYARTGALLWLVIATLI
jgi:F0F1-type ATP synthase assembly protein I